MTTESESKPPTTTAIKTRTITLTDRPPVKINEAEWPVIAKGDWHEGRIAAQANRSGWLRVRRHADGRAIVYGAYSTQWGGERDRRGGELLDKDADVAAAINRVAESVNAEECAADCIADLPPEEI